MNSSNASMLGALMLLVCSMAATIPKGEVVFARESPPTVSDRRVRASDPSVSENLFRALQSVVFVDASFARFEGSRSTVQDGATGVLVSPCLVLTAAHLFGQDFLDGTRTEPLHLRDLRVSFLVAPEFQQDIESELPTNLLPDRFEGAESGTHPLRSRSDDTSPPPTDYKPPKQGEKLDKDASASVDKEARENPPPVNRHHPEGSQLTEVRTIPFIGNETARRSPALSREVKTITSSASLVAAQAPNYTRNLLLDDWVLLRLEKPAPVAAARVTTSACCTWLDLPVKAAIGGFPVDRLIRDELEVWADTRCEVHSRLINSILATDCQATSGNSGGPLFIHDGSGWALAGLITRAPPPQVGGFRLRHSSYAILMNRDIISAMHKAEPEGCTG